MIRQKGIEKRFFDFLLAELYNLSDWKELKYEQMYELIHVLTMELSKADFDFLTDYKKLTAENQAELNYLMNYKIRKQSE